MSVTNAPARSGDAAQPAAVSVGQLFSWRVDKTPSAAAFQYRTDDVWRTLSWRQARERVFELAAGLIDLGLQSEQRVAIAAGTCIEWVLSDLAVMCAGGATTTVYPSTTAEEVAYILSDSGSVLVIAEDADQAIRVLSADLPELLAVVVMRGKAPDRSTGRPAVVTFDELALRGKARLAKDAGLIDTRIAAVQAEDLATLIYTSGTTGRPKGVRLVHANWTYESHAADQLNLLRENDVQYLWLPLSHVFGKALIAIQLEVGFCTAVDGDLTKIVENLAVIRPTFMAGAPRIFEKVRTRVTMTARGAGGLKAKIFDWAIAVGISASRGRQNGVPATGWPAVKLRLADKLVFSTIRRRLGGRIRFFISGSAALSPQVAEWFDGVGLTILEGYGLTETSAALSVTLPSNYRAGSVGPPLPGTEFVIAADGEILARGGGVMRGYHRNDAATEEVLTADGWFHTGDIGEIVEGALRVTDRKKDLIKTSGGKYVAPQKVEGIFKAICPYVSQIVVHGDGRKFISALITLDPEEMTGWANSNGLGTKSEAELAAEPSVTRMISGYVDELNSKLERWETVKKFIILPRDLTVEGGEMTPSMKVRRTTVEKQYLARFDELYQD